MKAPLLLRDGVIYANDTIEIEIIVQMAYNKPISILGELGFVECG